MIRESKNTSFLEFIFKLVEMGFIAVLSRYLLHVNYYRHHVIGYTILVLGLGVYGIIEIYEKIENINIEFLTALLLLIVYLASSFLEIIEKYLMDVKYVSPYLIISGEGFFGLIFTFISFFIFDDTCPDTFFLCEKKQSYYEIFIKFFTNINLSIAFFLFLIGVFLMNTFRMLTNQCYSPT